MQIEALPGQSDDAYQIAYYYERAYPPGPRFCRSRWTSWSSAEAGECLRPGVAESGPLAPFKSCWSPCWTWGRSCTSWWRWRRWRPAGIESCPWRWSRGRRLWVGKAVHVREVVVVKEFGARAFDVVGPDSGLSEWVAPAVGEGVECLY